MANTDGLLQVWQHISHASGKDQVFPDGCRDLIGRQMPGQAPSWMVSPLMDRTQFVQASEGERIVGYRLKPGATIHAESLLKAVSGLRLDDTQAVLDRLHAAVRLEETAREALLALSTERSLCLAQRQLGTSERGLQRLLRILTGRSPSYWRRLARLRQVTRNLASPAPLADLAADHGFADQAHMNREFQHWLGMSPGTLRKNPAAMNQLCEAGYG